MTKSIIKNDDGTILIELNKKGINAILAKDNDIKIGEYDGVDFTEKNMKKEDFVIRIVDEVKQLLSSCSFVSSIIMSDMFYVKFSYQGEDVIAFISEDGMITFDKDLDIPEEIKKELLLCVKRFKDIFLLSG